MTTTADITTTTLADAVTEAFLAGRGDALADLCADDVLVDLFVPKWRHQLLGREQTRRALVEAEFPPGREVFWHQRTDFADGVLLEIHSTAPMQGEASRWFELNRFRFAAGQVVELVQYCSGYQDAATQARNDAESPLVGQR